MALLLLVVGVGVGVEGIVLVRVVAAAAEGAVLSRLPQPVAAVVAVVAVVAAPVAVAAAVVVAAVAVGVPAAPPAARLRSLPVVARVPRPAHHVPRAAHRHGLRAARASGRRGTGLVSASRVTAGATATDAVAIAIAIGAAAAAVTVTGEGGANRAAGVQRYAPVCVCVRVPHCIAQRTMLTRRCVPRSARGDGVGYPARHVVQVSL